MAEVGDPNSPAYEHDGSETEEIGIVGVKQLYGGKARPTLESLFHNTKPPLEDDLENRSVNSQRSKHRRASIGIDSLKRDGDYETYSYSSRNTCDDDFENRSVNSQRSSSRRASVGATGMPMSGRDSAALDSHFYANKQSMEEDLDNRSVNSQLSRSRRASMGAIAPASRNRDGQGRGLDAHFQHSNKHRREEDAENRSVNSQRSRNRRASLGAAVPLPRDKDGYGTDRDDEKSVNSRSSRRSRRSSAGGATPMMKSMLGPARGYGSEDEDDDERSYVSSRSRTRRPSVSGNRGGAHRAHWGAPSPHNSRSELSYHHGSRSELIYHGSRGELGYHNGSRSDLNYHGSRGDLGFQMNNGHNGRHEMTYRDREELEHMGAIMQVSPDDSKRGRRASMAGPMFAGSSTDSGYQTHDYSCERLPNRSRNRRASMSGPLPQLDWNEEHPNFEPIPSKQAHISDSIHSVSRRPSTGGQSRRGSAASGMGSTDGMNVIRDRLPSNGDMVGAQHHHRPQITGTSEGTLSQHERRVGGGINPDAVARMSRRASGSGNIVEDDDVDYDYGEAQHAHPYGYQTYGYSHGVSQPGHGASQPRRGSGVSSNSNRSRRRNSCLVRKETNPFMAAELFSGPPRCSDSELESDDDAPLKYAYKMQDSTISGLNYSASSNMDVNGFDSDVSDSERSQGTESTMQTTKRAARRNSCVIRPEQDPIVGSLLDTNSPGYENDVTDDSDLFDPDSLLSRSGYFKRPSVQFASNPVSALHDVKEGDDEDNAADPSESFASEAPISPSRLIGGEDMPANKLIKPAESITNESWKRATPFTTSFTAPTEEKLKGVSEKPITTGSLPIHSMRGSIPIHSMRGNWGDVDVDHDCSTPSKSSSNSDSESFGESLYEDKPSQHELDRYRQRARRRDSLECTWVNMCEYVKTNPVKIGQVIPAFKPAEGCTNASDYLVRWFTARLRAGMTVLKHNRSRWSKSQFRVLKLLPDGKTLTWKPLEGEKDKGRRPRLDLSKCHEVRHAWSADPDSKRHLGTAVLRRKCRDGMASKSFALVFAKRTLDMTALSTDQYKVLTEGFSALCFRLNLSSGHDDDVSGHAKSIDADDDWASTVYGDTVLSLSLTSSTNPGQTAPPPTPWGV